MDLLCVLWQDSSTTCALVSLLTPSLPCLSVSLLDVPPCACNALEQWDLHVVWVLQAPLEYKLLVISEKINVLRLFFSCSVYSLGPFANPQGNINFKKS